MLEKRLSSQLRSNHTLFSYPPSLPQTNFSFLSQSFLVYVCILSTVVGESKRGNVLGAYLLGKT